MSDEGKDRIDNWFYFVCKTWQDFGRLGRLRVFQTPNNSSLRKAFIYQPPKPPKPPENNFCVGPSQPIDSESPPPIPNPRLTFEVEGNIGRPLNGVSLARARTSRGAFDQMSVGHCCPGRCRPGPGAQAVTVGSYQEYTGTASSKQMGLRMSS